MSGVVVEIVRHDQIQPTVPVKIEKRRRRSPTRVVDPRGLGDVDEPALALVQQEPHAAVFGAEHVRQAVVVDVTNRHPHAGTCDIESRTGTDIAEASVRLLMIELIAGRGVRAAVLDQVQIQPSVVVVIEQGDARAHLLRNQVAAGGAGGMDELHSGPGGDLLKPWGARI